MSYASAVPVPAPTETTRWRCALCGNLTRFDRTVARRTVEFVHVDLAGDAVVEDTEVVTEEVQEIRCRWCGSTDVELVPRPDAAGEGTVGGGP